MTSRTSLPSSAWKSAAVLALAASLLPPSAQAAMGGGASTETPTPSASTGAASQPRRAAPTQQPATAQQVPPSQQAASAQPAPGATQPAPASAQPAPPPPPPTYEDDDDDGPGTGVYFDITGGPMFGITSSHEWSGTCPSVDALGYYPGCEATMPIGVVGEGRLGIRLGYVGLEAFALGAGDWSSAKLKGQLPNLLAGLPSIATNMQIGRVGGGLGAGLRVISSPGLVRFGVGAGGGMMFRYVYTSLSSLDGSNTSYAAPMVRADLGFTFLNVFNIGVMGWLEFSGNVEVQPGGGIYSDATLELLQNSLGDITVFDGVQYFVGPYVGLHFGN